MEMQVAAWIAAGLVYCSFFMKTIIPLRALAIASNVVFIAYALLGMRHDVFDKVLPILVLHVALLPLNVIRLLEVRRTIRALRSNQGGQASLEVLMPYMKHEQTRRGQVLFKRGDKAECMYILRQGQIVFPDVGKTLVSGAMFGEVGVFSENTTRTSAAICETDCELLSISGDKVLELFYMDTRFGLFIVRLLSGYLGQPSGLQATVAPDTAEPEQAPFE